MSGTAVPANAEEHKQRVIAALEQHRADEWGIGDAVVAALRANAEDAPSEQAAKDRRPKVYRWLADGTGQTAAFFRQHAEVSAAFPEPGQRLPDKSWTWHRAVLNAAVRTERTPMEMQMFAVAADLDVPALSQLGAAQELRAIATGECVACGFTTTVRGRGAAVTTAGVTVSRQARCGQCTRLLATFRVVGGEA